MWPGVVPSSSGIPGGGGVTTSLVLAVLAQLRGQELVLLLSDHSQLFPGFTKLLFFTQHFLLSRNDLGSNADRVSGDRRRRP